MESEADKAERRRRAESVARTRRKRRGWTPYAGPQLDAYLAARRVDDLGYGGGGGGGKSQFALGLAFLQHRRSIIYRRTVPQLAGIEEDAKKVYAKKGKYNEQRKVWRLTRTCDHAGRKLAKSVPVFIQFGSMNLTKDWEKWRGTPFDCRIFDEAQNFLREQCLSVMAWTRTTTQGQHCNNVFTFNPPTEPGGLWLIDYFAPWLDKTHPDPAAPGEVRWFITLADGKEKEVPGPRDWRDADFTAKRPAPVVIEERAFLPRSRTFFPALATDNPALMASGYMAMLDALPEPLRSQMRDGDFSAGFKDGVDQLIKTEWVRAAIKRGKEKSRPVDAQGKPRPITALGVDVAAGGDDLNAFAPRVGDWYGEIKIVPGSETPTGTITAMHLVESLDGGKDVSVNIDAIGVGKGLETACEQQGIPINAINVAEASFGRDRTGLLKFANKRAEMYWQMREALDPESGRNICLPDDKELLADLTAPRYSLTAAGITIEPKAKTKIDRGVGMHKGEAVMLANYEPGKAKYGSLPGRGGASSEPTPSGLHPIWGR